MNVYNEKDTNFITIKNLSKSFGGNKALDQVNFDLKQGEVHCLAGGNGSGKSTLIKVICGIHKPDSGSDITINGQKIKSLTPAKSKALGIQVIYQDLSLFPNLSIAENIAFEDNLKSIFSFFNYKKQCTKAKKIIDELNFNLNLNTIVETLSIAQRQQVAICRALVADAKLVIMDEPTASLTRAEVNNLLNTVNYLKSKNISVIFVSHKLDEVLAISERVTVIKDGIKQGCFDAKDITPERLAELITGVKIDFLNRHIEVDDDSPIILETENLTKENQYQDISMRVRKGQVVGLCGLLGSGRTELALSIFGITKPDSGKIYVNSVPVKFKNHVDAMKSGIGYVSEDWLTLGLILEQSVTDNTILSIINQIKTKLGLLDNNRIRDILNSWVNDLDIKVKDINLPISTLSGGNQQKIVLAKWILTNPKILILDSPTVGVDVGAKDSIYKLIRELADQGISIILISDEIPEVYYNCDEIFYFNKGSLLWRNKTRDISIESLMEVVNAG